jgi:hypothetical protein
MLRRDLALPFEGPRAAIDIDIRPIDARDVPKLLDTNATGLLPHEKWYRASRRRLLDAGFGRCYVAVTSDDQPCHMQWLFTSTDNERIQSYFGGTFPILAADETLLESGFTPGKFRRLGIMAAAVAKIAERATTRWIITFIGAANITSIKGCMGAGFTPYAGCTQRWRLLRCTLIFHPVDGWTAHAAAPTRVSRKSGQGTGH